MTTDCYDLPCLVQSLLTPFASSNQDGKMLSQLKKALTGLTARYQPAEIETQLLCYLDNMEDVNHTPRSWLAVLEIWSPMTARLNDTHVYARIINLLLSQVTSENCDVMPAVKLLLTMCRHCGPQIGRSLYGHNSRDSSSQSEVGAGDSKVQIERINSELFRIVESENHDAEVRMLTASACARLMLLARPCLANRIILDLTAKRSDTQLVTDVGCRDLPSDHHAPDVASRRHAHFSPFSCTALLLGYLSFCDDVTNADDNFTDQTFDTIDALCRTEDHIYHNYRLLLCWVKLCHRHGRWTVFRPESSRRCLHLLWARWDCPVSGVSDTVSDVFHHIIEGSRCAMTVMERESWMQEILGRIMGAPWTSRGKLSFLSRLLPHLDVQMFLAARPSVPRDLVGCLAANFTAALSADVYRTCLQKLSDQLAGDVTHYWSDTWLPVLVENGLTNQNQLVRYNCCHFWIPITLRYVPGSFHVLGDLLTRQLDSHVTRQLCGHVTHDVTNCYLHAWISVMKSAASQQTIDLTECMGRIRNCLYHSDEQIRADAFLLLGTAHKKTDPVKADILSLLREALPLNLNIDHAPFRMRMCTAMKSLLGRIRDASAYLLNRDKDDPRLAPMLDFVDWLHTLCLTNLFPGASYQRYTTVLDVMALIYQNFYVNDSSARSASGAGSVSRLELHVRQEGLWKFADTNSARALFSAFLSDIPEVHVQASQLLDRHFIWPLVLPGVTSDVLVTSSLQMCCSPKAQKANSGARVCQLLFKKYVMEIGSRYIVHDFKCTSQPITDVGANLSDDVIDGGGPIIFLVSLLQCLRYCVNASTANVLEGAVHYPGHGLVLAIHYCLQAYTQPGTRLQRQMVTPVLVEIVEQCGTIVDNVLSVLSGQSQSPETAPSFAQMGVAILSAITTSGDDVPGADDDVGDDVTVSLSDDYQHVLTWCWMNIKECSSLLSRLVEWYLDLLSVDQVWTVARTLVKILTTCRHRGAIESCNLSFAATCGSLLRSTNQDLRNIPSQLLDEVLSVLRKDGLVTSSVTRRSAGLPLLVQAITASEIVASSRKATLLSRAMTSLMHIAEQPIRDTDQKVDLPQVHAINILKGLFKDSRVADTCFCHVTRAVKMAVLSFHSHIWSVRNAAMQLFGALIQRVFGQKKSSKFSVTSATSADEFFSHHPLLQPFFIDELQSGHLSSDRLFHPSAFPILSLLARLAPSVDSDVQRERGPSGDSDVQRERGPGGDSDVQRERGPYSELSQAISPYLTNPVLKIRSLAAEALCVFLSVCDVIVLLVHADWSKFNIVHGMLLLVDGMVERKHADTSGNLTPADTLGGLTPADMSGNLTPANPFEHLTPVLLQHDWLASSTNGCGLTRYLYISVMRKLGVSFTQQGDAFNLITLDTPEIGGQLMLSRTIRDLMLSRDPRDTVTPPADDTDDASANRSAVTFIDTPTMTRLLNHGSSDVRRECLQTVMENLVETDGTQLANILPVLFDRLLSETNPQLRLLSMETIHAIQLHHVLSTSCDVIAVMEPWYTRPRDPSILSAHALVVAAPYIADDVDIRRLMNWCRHLYQCSLPSQTEAVRLLASRCLLATTPHLLTGRCRLATTPHIVTSQHLDDKWSHVTVMMFSSLWLLLQDECADVRKLVADATSGLNRPEVTGNVQEAPQKYHFNKALEELCQHITPQKHDPGHSLNPVISRDFTGDPTMTSHIVAMLYQPGDVIAELTIYVTTSQTPLFQSDDMNAFTEKISQKRLLARIVKNYPSSYPLPDTHLVEEVRNTAEILEKIDPVDLLLLRCPNFHAACAGLILVTQIRIVQLQDGSPQSVQLSREFQRLVAVYPYAPSVHLQN